jgi:enoyl-CoA hydratase
MSEILLEKSERVGEIILNRPEKLNALTLEMYHKLIEALTEVEKDDAIRVVVLSGAGRAFCAGWDLSQEARRDPDYVRKKYEVCNAARWKIWDLKKPIIAKIHGYCVGAGCHLAIVSDFTIASKDATFSESEVQFSEVSQFLIEPWVLGMKKAKKFLMTGETITAAEAENIGLITQVVPRGKLDEETEKLVKTLVKIPSFGLSLTKRMINKAYEFQGLRDNVDFDLEIAIMSGIFEPEEVKVFNQILKEKGAKAAFAYRDKMFKDL